MENVYKDACAKTLAYLNENYNLRWKECMCIERNGFIYAYGKKVKTDKDYVELGTITKTWEEAFKWIQGVFEDKITDNDKWLLKDIPEEICILLAIRGY